MKYGDKIYYTTYDQEVVEYPNKQKVIDKNYKYRHSNIFYRLSAWLAQIFVAEPFAFIFSKAYHVKIVGRKKLKKVGKNSYFIYSNHTNQILDVFQPVNTCFPKNVHYIVNSANVSQKFLGKLTERCGAIPLPDTIEATRNFTDKIERTLKKNKPIVIYPERHLWPYYTSIRPFDEKSFRYPVKYKKPIYVFTTTYQKRKEGKLPKTTIYVDGPFYPDENLPIQEQRKTLREYAYNTMCERAKNSNYNYFEYIKKEKEEN